MYQYLVKFYGCNGNCYCCWVKINEGEYGLKWGVENNCKGGNLKYCCQVKFFILMVDDVCGLYKVDFMVQLMELIFC